MNYQITLRYGKARQRYLTLQLEAEDAVEALRLAPDRIPAEVADAIDLVELRVAPDENRERNFMESG